MYTLAADTWAAWQMFPGYLGERCVPYCSPIWIQSVQPMKTGSGRLRLGFLNTLYAQGVQDFDVELQILKRADNYLAAGVIGNQDRMVVISHIEFEWVRRFCPELWANRPSSRCSPNAQASVSVYLSEVFGLSAGHGRS